MSKETYWRRLVTSSAPLILVLFLGLPATLWAQKQQASWSDLNRLKAGQGIEVIESSMKHHSGEFIDVTDEILTFQEGGSDLSIKRTQNAFPPTPGLILPATYVCVSLNDYDVVLARTDLPAWIFQWRNPQSGQFVNELILPTPLGPVPYPRAWASVDAQFFGHPFHYINTHLESFDANIRELQGDELRAGPANTSLPVIIAMDSNAQAFPLPEDPTYSDFISAGYNNVWFEIFPRRAGLTCCQDEADNNPVSQLYQRIDLVLTHGRVTPWEALLIGANPRSRLPDGLWPSDHAALEAGVVVGND